MKIRKVNKSKHKWPEYSAKGYSDADYRSEVCSIPVNLSGGDSVIKDGNRICRMVIAEYEKSERVITKTLPESDIDTGSFRHT